MEAKKLRRACQLDCARNMTPARAIQFELLLCLQGLLCEESFFFFLISPFRLLVFWFPVFSHNGSFHVGSETRKFETTTLALRHDNPCLLFR